MDINTCFATTSDLRNLALYANFVPAVTSIILAGFVLRKAVNRQKAIAFASFVGVFALWLIAAGIIWTSNDYYLVAALWTPIDYFALLFFLLIFCFFCIDVFDNIPHWISIVVVLIASVSFGINLLGQGAFGFDQSWCNMNNNEFLTVYNLWIGIIILLTIFVLGIYRFIKLQGNKTERARISIVTGSIVLFMGIFLGSEYWSSVTNNYTTELYALFTLPIFILFLTIAITSYGTFRLGDAAAKALFYIYLVSSGALFFFVTSTASLIIITIAFVMALSFGVLLLQKYEEVEELTHRQESLIHAMNHQIKGYLGVARNVFAELLTTDYGQMPEQSKPLVTHGLEEMGKGVEYVQGILNSTSAQNGMLLYDKKPVDLKSLISNLVSEQKDIAEKKGLSFESTIADGDYTVSGDATKLEEAFKNLIANSILYNNPNGSIVVTLSHTDQKVLFVVKDTGIGISKDDQERLYKPGGMGKDSIKHNANASGYGLAFIEPVIKEHQGKIWYETEVGKGTTFFVELPVNQPNVGG